MVRADYKTKEVYTHTHTQCDNCVYTQNIHIICTYIVSLHWNQILDVWPYQVLKNWGYTDQTFILEFEDRTYPVKTGQGRWMNALVDFHIESILGDLVSRLLYIAYGAIYEVCLNFFANREFTCVYLCAHTLSENFTEEIKLKMFSLSDHTPGDSSGID